MSSDSSDSTRLSGAQRGVVAFGLIVLVYMVGVILFGAWVRITGSGAGCGQHWPTCHGQVVPRVDSVETAIEFTHRLTSGFAGILTFILAVATFRAYPRRHAARRWIVAACVFLIIEALIGAALVRLELVAMNDSPTRAVWMAGHLANTLFLSATLALSTWYAAGRPPPRRGPIEAVHVLIITSLLGLLVVAMSGAVTALGDTLYPIVVDPQTGLLERVRSGLSPTGHFLVRMRAIHPFLSVVVGVFLVAASFWISARRSDPVVTLLARWTVGLVVVQLVAGVVNIVLSAPGWMQLLHLLLAELLWIAAILLAAAAFASRSPQRDDRLTSTPERI